MNNEQIRIIYMGTPDFAVSPLRALVEKGLNVVAVITMPDKPSGRGQKIQYSPVKEYALQANIPVLQPEKLKDPDFIEQLRSYRADLQIVVAFRMLPEVVWAMPRLGTFNLHASLLPQYRGAAPINWAVINGEKQTGVTTFMLQHEIDTGNIILQDRLDIGSDEDAGSVHDRLNIIGTDLVLRTVEMIIDCDNRNCALPMIAQPTDLDLHTAPKLFRETCEILFDRLTPIEIHNLVRGLSPYPAAWCNLNIAGKIYNGVKIYKANDYKGKVSDVSVCTIVDEQRIYQAYVDHQTLIVPCKDGYIELLELQLPGKKRMDAKSLLNGLRIN